MSAPPKLDVIAQFYQARSKLIFGLGKDKYKAQITPIIAELRKVMSAHNCNELMAARMMTNAITDEKDPMRRKVLSAYIWSAALDLDEENAKHALHPTP